MSRIVNRRKKVYRRCLIVILFLSLAGLGGLLFYEIKATIPDQIRIVTGEEQKLDFDLPIEAIVEEDSVLTFSGGKTGTNGEIHLNLSEEIVVSSEEKGDCSISCKLWGIIPLKKVTVEAFDSETVIPCGQPVGIYIHTRGVMVIGTGSVTGLDGMEYEPAYPEIQSGDYIVAVDDTAVTNKKELIRAIKHAEDDNVVVSVVRNGEEMKIQLERIKTGNDEYKLGIWVREDTQGVGMLTYVDMEGNYGALGHSINDQDTGSLMEINEGSIMESRIVSVTKGLSGAPGELVGVINYGEIYELGNIEKNTEEGIFGNGGTELCDFATRKGMEPMEIEYKQNVEIGPATIYCNIDGTPREYDVEITDVNINENKRNKEIELKVTDSELIELTGGIVQGMSGSPIIQNGKIVGAVTHVLVKEPTKGYGIFIEEMLKFN